VTNSRYSDSYFNYREELMTLPPQNGIILGPGAAQGILSTAITHFNRAIYAGVYGLDLLKQRDNAVQDASDITQLCLQRLWSRQLYLDTCYRPIIIAKLRHLARQQCT
jgi:hypothetical protein